MVANVYRNLLLSLHIVGVAACLGANLVGFVLTPLLARHGAEVAAAWASSVSTLARTYYNSAGVVVGVTGVLLVQHTGYGWGSGFVAVGISALVVGAALGIAVFAPTGDRLAASLRGGDERTAARLKARTTRFLCVDTAVVLVTVLAMVARWKAR